MIVIIIKKKNGWVKFVFFNVILKTIIKKIYNNLYKWMWKIKCQVKTSDKKYLKQKREKERK